LSRWQPYKLHSCPRSVRSLHLGDFPKMDYMETLIEVIEVGKATPEGSDAEGPMLAHLKVWHARVHPQSKAHQNTL
jgi:hypothetical protein